MAARQNSAGEQGLLYFHDCQSINPKKYPFSFIKHPFSFIVFKFKSIRVDPGRSGLIRVDPTRIKRSELIQSEFCTCLLAYC